MDKEICDQLPAHIYWKDKESVMRGLNSLDGSDASSLIGLKDDDLPWAVDPESYRKHDREVMETGERIAFLEHGKDEEGTVHEYISIKGPLKNDKGEIIGTTGVSFPKALLDKLKS